MTLIWDVTMGLRMNMISNHLVVWLCGRELICYHVLLAIVADCCRRQADNGGQKQAYA